MNVSQTASHDEPIPDIPVKTICRLALLVNFVAPYRIKLLEELATQVGELKVFVSTKMESNRPWTFQAGMLDITLQRTWTFTANHRRSSGITQRLFIHIPYDTLILLIRYKPQVVISGEMGMRSLQAALYRWLRPRSRLLIWATLSEHTEKEWGIVRRTLRRLIVQSADVVLVNGQSGARYIEQLVSSKRITVVNQPIAVEPFLKWPVQRHGAQSRHLLFSGRLIAQKGVFELQDTVARCAATLPNQIFEITWAGDGEERPGLEATKMPANVRQTFTGHLDYEALGQLYSCCGALVLPTMFDEWGLVVNEALTSGLPVVGSIYSQAVTELVEDGVTGWHFDPKVAGSLQSALVRFFEEPEDRLAVMRLRARDRAMQVTISGAVQHILAAAHSVVD